MTLKGCDKMKIYCPHCGNELIQINRELYCQNGECYFGQYFGRIFIEKINLTEVIDHESELLNQSKLYCIKCGKLMSSNTNLKSMCRECKLVIEKELFIRIIELCPHL